MARQISSPPANLSGSSPVMTGSLKLSNQIGRDFQTDICRPEHSSGALSRGQGGSWILNLQQPGQGGGSGQLPGQASGSVSEQDVRVPVCKQSGKGVFKTYLI